MATSAALPLAGGPRVDHTRVERRGSPVFERVARAIHACNTRAVDTFGERIVTVRMQLSPLFSLSLTPHMLKKHDPPKNPSGNQPTRGDVSRLLFHGSDKVGSWK